MWSQKPPEAVSDVNLKIPWGSMPPDPLATASYDFLFLDLRYNLRPGSDYFENCQICYIHYTVTDGS